MAGKGTLVITISPVRQLLFAWRDISSCSKIKSSFGNFYMTSCSVKVLQKIIRTLVAAITAIDWSENETSTGLYYSFADPSQYLVFSTKGIEEDENSIKFLAQANRDNRISWRITDAASVLWILWDFSFFPHRVLGFQYRGNQKTAFKYFICFIYFNLIYYINVGQFLMTPTVHATLTRCDPQQSSAK